MKALKVLGVVVFALVACAAAFVCVSLAPMGIRAGVGALVGVLVFGSVKLLQVKS